MRRAILSAVAVLSVTVTAFVSGASADNPLLPLDGGTVVQQCYDRGSSSLDDSGYKFCRSLQALLAGTAAACRTPLRAAPDASLPEYCGAFDGREVSEARIAAYEKSWVHRALTLQRGLDESAPLMEELLGHTHNSFNASSYAIPTDGSLPSYYATLTNQDPNQVYSITDQLRMDIRAIEIDLHWVPSPYGTVATHGYWPTMCHGDGQKLPSGTWVHVGCTDDRPMQDGLAEVKRWLRAHPHEFLLIYLENQLAPGDPIASQEQAHNVAANIINEQLGGLVYVPPTGLKAGSCASMPYEKTRSAVLASGKQVMLVGNCGPGAWNQWVFERGPRWDESGNPTTYDAKSCAADMQARASHSTFRRFYEESPWLEAMTNATQVLTAKTTAEMVRCGVNIIGFDQLEPFDGRLAAMVWSWAPNEPNAAGGHCALRGSDSRFRAAECLERHAFVCTTGQRWFVSDKAGLWRRGSQICAQQIPGSWFAVPPNGYRNALLGSSEAWLGYRETDGAWRPLARPMSLPHTG